MARTDWATLFERAEAFDVTLEEVRTALAARRRERNGDDG